MMQRELVENRRWISQARFNHALNYCMLLPGPEAQQLATYIGWLMHRTPGALMAGGLFVLPSLFILIALSWVYVSYGKLPTVAAILWGLQCAVAVIVIHALWRVASRTIGDPRQSGFFAGLALLSFVALAIFKISFLWIVLFAGLMGWWAVRHWPEHFAPTTVVGPQTKAQAKSSNSVSQLAEFLIGDQTPTPKHAVFSRAKFFRVLVIGLSLWGLSFAALVATFGWSASVTQMGLFFSKAAMVTFGGAYAVLPYVTQTAVEQQWLTAEQMMAGLALGESTPGPLIMLVAFVGYVGQALEVQRLSAGANLAGVSIFLMGCVGAVVATWFTFLPSFVFILAGGPFVESTHGKLSFSGPLRAISAAVVGAIASLALLFVSQTIFGGASGISGANKAAATSLAIQLATQLDWAAIGLMALIAYLTFVRTWATLPVIGVGALVGLLVA